MAEVAVRHRRPRAPLDALAGRVSRVVEFAGSLLAVVAMQGRRGGACWRPRPGVNARRKGGRVFAGKVMRVMEFAGRLP